MAKLIDSIPNKIPNVKEITEMIKYINDVVNELDIVIIERGDGAHIVVPTEIYNENLQREQMKKPKISNKNVLTCWQYTTKIVLSIRPEFNPQRDLKSCEFRNLAELEAKDIATKIKKKYGDLL